MSRVRALGPGELKRHTLPPVTGGDKDRHGSLLVIAGSRDVPGAALLAGEAAMRAGAGRLQCAVPDCMALPLGLALPFAMVAGYSTARDGGFSRRAISPLVDRAAEADAIVAGPGLRGNPAAEKLAGALLALGKPLALDAALLHALPGHDRAARRAAVPPLLLPHAGELASLLGCAEEDVTADPH